MVQKVERERESHDGDCIKKRPSGGKGSILAVYFKDQKKTWGKKKHLFIHRSDISVDFVANYLTAPLKFRILGKFLLSECSTSQGTSAGSLCWAEPPLAPFSGWDFIFLG